MGRRREDEKWGGCKGDTCSAWGRCDLRCNRAGYSLEPLTRAGQVCKGDILLISGATSGRVETVKEIVNSGVASDSDGEEIIINKRKNHYFITSVYLDGKSWAKRVLVLRWV